MDTSTQNLIVTTAGVVLSGIFGAVSNGYFNHRTTQATIKKERTMWKLEKEYAQKEAILSQKRAAYQQLLKNIDSLNLLLTRTLDTSSADFFPIAVQTEEEALTAQIAQVMLYINNQDLEYNIKSIYSRLSRTIGILNEAHTQRAPASRGLLQIHNAEMLRHREDMLSGFRDDLQGDTPQP